MRGWPCRHAKRIVLVNGFHYHKIGINLMERVLDKGAQVVARKNISPSSSLCWTQTASSATDGCLPLADRSTHSGPVTMGVKVVIRIIVPLVECRRWTTSDDDGDNDREGLVFGREWPSIAWMAVGRRKVQKVFPPPENSALVALSLR